MKSMRIISSFIALIFGFFVLLVSFLAASEFEVRQASFDRSFYFDRKILPDHSLYPVLMARDRLTLESATPEKRVEIRLEYAQKRLESALQLASTNRANLAISTLSKAQKYVLEAALEAQEIKDPTVALTVAAHAQQLQTQVTTAQKKYPALNSPLINDLNTELGIAQSNLLAEFSSEIPQENPSSTE